VGDPVSQEPSRQRLESRLDLTLFRAVCSTQTASESSSAGWFSPVPHSLDFCRVISRSPQIPLGPHNANPPIRRGSQKCCFGGDKFPKAGNGQALKSFAWLVEMSLHAID